MNAEMATDVLNRHIAHMAESAIHQSANSAAAAAVVPKSIDDCGQLMSLWRPIVCRSSPMYPPVARSSSDHHPPSYHSADPQSTSPSSNHKVNKSAVADQSNNLANGKSIPVHCVVMNTATPCYMSDDVTSVLTENGTAAKGSANDEVDVDSYAIIPASTLFTQIVPAVLRKLGYSDELIFNATGWLMMKKWRPLALTQIALSDRETVGDILGELTTVATLRIYVRKSHCGNGANSPQMETKNKVLRWLMTRSQHLISSSRFPLDEQWQQKVVRGERPQTPSPETQRQFDAWFQQEMVRSSPSSHHHLQSQLSVNRSGGDRLSSNQLVSPSAASSSNAADGTTATLHGAPTVADMTARDVLPPRVRMRTTFDPEQELPRLQRWFSENQHPTRFQLQLFVEELNELDTRRGRKPLDVSNLVYWFKNARAAYKRAEVRNSQCESANATDNWIGGQGSMQGCLGEESSDDNRRLDDDEDGNVGTVSADEDDDSSVSDRSYDRHPESTSMPLPLTAAQLKSEPQDLNRSHEEQEAGKDQLGDGRAIDEDDDDAMSHASDSDSDMEDYAENLSLSKAQIDGEKSGKEALQSGNASSSHPGDYTSAYPGFPLSLAGHAQLGQHGLVYMSSPYLQGIGSSLLHHSGSAHMHHHRTGSLDPLTLASVGGSGGGGDDRRKRNRTFIDPVTEVPRLEHWFSLNTHPSHSLVLRYTEDLNRQPYRLKFPKLEPKNVQFWFKNRRAKCKRLKLAL